MFKDQFWRDHKRYERKVSGWREPGTEFKEDNADKYHYNGGERVKSEGMVDEGQIISSEVATVTNSYFIKKEESRENWAGYSGYIFCFYQITNGTV